MFVPRDPKTTKKKCKKEKKLLLSSGVVAKCGEVKYMVNFQVCNYVMVNEISVFPLFFFCIISARVHGKCINTASFRGKPIDSLTETNRKFFVCLLLCVSNSPT